MTIDTNAFLDSLPIMGAGLLGIFIVTGVIIIGIYIMRALTRKKAEPVDNAEAAGEEGAAPEAAAPKAAGPKQTALDLMKEREKTDFLETDDDPYTFSKDL